MDDQAKLTFKLQDKNGNGDWKRPVWKEVDVENATCPHCGVAMVVVLGDILYAYCNECKHYFIGT